MNKLRNVQSLFSSFRAINKGSKRNGSFYHRHLEIEKCNKKQRIPSDPKKLEFGKYFTNHMVDIDWDTTHGWFQPKIKPFQNFSMHPASKVLHYGVELFEGMKAYYGVDGKIRLFRPEMNMERMRRSAVRCCFPDFSTDQALLVIDELIRLEQELVPRSEHASLYIRPFMFPTEPVIRVSESTHVKWSCFGSPCGTYFNDGDTGLTLLADPNYVRSWPGGVGQYKMGCNYAPTIYPTKIAKEKHGCSEIMWLSGQDRQITEAGAMNLFVFWRNEDGVDELITPPKETGLILPGVTRQSVIDLAREWNEVRVSEKNFTIDELSRAIKENRVHEFFVAGTAALVSPVSKIIYMDREKGVEENMEIPTTKSMSKMYQRFYKTITDIQYGRIEKTNWQRVIEV